ncbi:MAG: hypothetical protein AAFZ15_06805 [Bacteroidota bacterium]
MAVPALDVAPQHRDDLLVVLFLGDGHGLVHQAPVKTAAPGGPPPSFHRDHDQAGTVIKGNDVVELLWALERFFKVFWGCPANHKVDLFIKSHHFPDLYHRIEEVVEDLLVVEPQQKTLGTGHFPAVHVDLHPAVGRFPTAPAGNEDLPFRHACQQLLLGHRDVHWPAILPFLHTLLLRPP